MSRNGRNYKWCIVPACKNNSTKTPKKQFIYVPKNAEIRKKWLHLASRNPDVISLKSVIFFCEDHFDLEKDIANYQQTKMGFSRRNVLVDGVLPSKHLGQQDLSKTMCRAVCRVCRGRFGLLRVDTLKGHSTLLESYEILTNRKLNAAGRSTATMCFTCVSQLQRCHRLSDAAHRSNRIRQGMSTRGFVVPYTNITALNLGTTQHLSALPYLTEDNNENTLVTVKQEQVAVKEEILDDDWTTIY